MTPFDPDKADMPGEAGGLERLHRELDAVEFTERPSFDPELRAELEKAWPTAQANVRRPSLARAGAAVAAALVLVAVIVPPARAGLARLLLVVQDGAGEVLEEPVAPVELPATVAETPERVVQDFRYVTDDEPAATPPEVTGPETFPRGPVVTFPALDRELSEDLIQRHYPTELQLARVGGIVRLQLWVDEEGSVSEAEVASSSGVGRLDRAALMAARQFQFSPARRYGLPVGTWVEFDVRFRPPLPDFGPMPVVAALEELSPEAFETPELEAGWVPSSDPPPVSSLPVNARELLWGAMEEDGRIDQRWGDLEHLLAGEPPAGQRPLEWREDAVEALEAALTRDPANPAPFLALGRIRRSQGLRDDARRLFGRGIDRALEAGRRVPSAVLADLHYERGALLREEWLAWSDLGEVAMVAFAAVGCPRVSPVSPGGSYSISETLIAWNYLCPDRFAELMGERFQPLAPLKEGDFNEMMRSMDAAIDADAGHLRANLAVLLALADQDRWVEAREGARAFVGGSARHPRALLFSGLALHHLGRPVEALEDFREALSGMPYREVRDFVDIAPLLEPEDADAYSALDGEARARYRELFWDSHDPLLVTAVNERRVEHLARAAYAHLRFGGVTTDAGEIWLRYGEPMAVRSVEDGAGLRTVFWDYGPGPDFTFRRPSVSMRLELTEEGRAHLDEFSRVFPHRYDALESSILPLTGQVGQFRGADGSIEVEVHTRIPAELAAPGAAIQLAASLSTGDGDRWIVERRALSDPGAPIRLSVPVPDRARRLVLELYHPGVERAATLSAPIRPTVTRGGTTLSDLLLVEPVSPFAPSGVERGSVEARTRPGQPEGDRVGVFFELYDLPRGTAGYVVHVEAVNLATNGLARLGFKPAGELEFRRVWKRMRRVESRLNEYLTVDLADLSPGSYLLRVLISRPEGGPVEVTSRAVEIG